MICACTLAYGVFVVMGTCCLVGFLVAAVGKYVYCRACVCMRSSKSRNASYRGGVSFPCLNSGLIVWNAFAMTCSCVFTCWCIFCLSVLANMLYECSVIDPFTYVYREYCNCKSFSACGSCVREKSSRCKCVEKYVDTSMLFMTKYCITHVWNMLIKAMHPRYELP